MPVHEVSTLIETKVSHQDSEAAICKAGQIVIGEFTLLNVFPRDISDAHLSGAIHVDGLGTWVLKPNEVIHDLRYFFQHGLQLDNPLWLSMEPPNDFKTALSIAFNVLLHANKEINQSQTFNYFNIFLAPFIKGLEPVKIKESLRLFILNLNQHSKATLGLDLTIPKVIIEKKAFGPKGKVCGNYSDYIKGTQLLASILIDIFLEETHTLN